MPVFVFATPATLHEQSLYWGRTDYQDLDWRTSWQGQAADQWPEWVWQGSQSLGKSAELFAGQLGTGGYSGPLAFDKASDLTGLSCYRVVPCLLQPLLTNCTLAITGSTMHT